MIFTRPVPAEDRATGRVVAAGEAVSRTRLMGRLLAFAGITVVAGIVVPAVLYPAVRAAHAVVGGAFLGADAMTCIATIVATAITVRIFGESWRLSTRLGADALGAWPLLGGIASGWFAIAAPTGLLIWMGALRLVPAEQGSWWVGAGLAASILVPAALSEELVLRGYAFTLLQRAWGVRAAVAGTSLAFGLLHLFNPGVTVQAILCVTLAGVFLALVRLAFNSLWAAWLAHFAFNFVQVAVFHTPVSGLAVPQPYYRTVSAGAVWLTGGAWGPEAGAAAALGMLGVSFLLAIRAGWVRVRRRGWRFDIDVRPHGRREQ